MDSGPPVKLVTAHIARVQIATLGGITTKEVAPAGAASGLYVATKGGDSLYPLARADGVYTHNTVGSWVERMEPPLRSAGPFQYGNPDWHYCDPRVLVLANAVHIGPRAFAGHYHDASDQPGHPRPFATRAAALHDFPGTTLDTVSTIHFRASRHGYATLLIEPGAFAGFSALERVTFSGYHTIGIKALSFPVVEHWDFGRPARLVLGTGFSASGWDPAGPRTDATLLGTAGSDLWTESDMARCFRGYKTAVRVGTFRKHVRLRVDPFNVLWDDAMSMYNDHTLPTV